jgi:hypothetical protein
LRSRNGCASHRLRKEVAAMFEIVEKPKRTPEEKKVIVLEYLAAVAICFIVGVVLWMIFTAGG